MTQSAKAQEPSMEEILASIRRIIADDDAAKPPPPKAEAAKPAAVAPPAEKPAPRPAAPPPPPPPPAANTAITQDEVDEIEFVRPGAYVPAEKAEPAAADVLDLTESMRAMPEPPAPTSFRTIDAQSDVVFREVPPRPPERAAPAEKPQPASPKQAAPPPERALLSASTSAAIDSAFNTLAQTVLIQNACTLEDLVKEMLRPMLKGWLDDNLPGLVERIVRAEIERVSRSRT
jgi:uncharacterized protein